MSVWLAVSCVPLASVRRREEVAYSLALSPSNKAAWKPLRAVAMATTASRWPQDLDGLDAPVTGLVSSGFVVLVVRAVLAQMLRDLGVDIWRR